MLQVYWRTIQAKRSHQGLVHPTAWPQQSGESHSDHHRRQHKGNGRQRLEQRLARKLITGKDICARQRQDQRQQRRESRLPDGKPEDTGVVISADQFAQRQKIQRPLRREAEDNYRKERVEEKEDKEQKRDEVKQYVKSPPSLHLIYNAAHY